MPIHLLTGRPRHGKTSEMMAMLLEAIKKGDRPVYAAGIDGLAPGLCEVLPDASKWCSHVPYEPAQYDVDDAGKRVEKLQTVINVPDGSLIFVDEAWKWFGHLHSAVGKPTPRHVLALAEHGHHGIDFVWTSQGPGQIYPFVRTLIEQHWHFVRRWGTKVVDIYKWDDLQDDVKSKAARELSQKKTTTLNSAGWAHYKSASLHTVKARLPWKVFALPVIAVAAVALLWFTYQALRPEAMVPKAFAGEVAGLPAASPEAVPGQPSVRANPSDNGLSEYLAAQKMRAPGLHGSQPIFDGREVAAVPRTYCVMSGGDNGDERCTCYTEQATRLLDVRQDVCRHTARWGQYDPFLAPAVGTSGELASDDAQEAPQVASGSRAPPGQVGSATQGAMWGKVPDTLRASGE